MHGLKCSHGMKWGTTYDEYKVDMIFDYFFACILADVVIGQVINNNDYVHEGHNNAYEFVAVIT